MTISPPISFGDINFVADSLDADGVAWVCENLAGWAEPAGTTQSPTNRALDHGGWFSDGWYVPRLLTLEGVVDAPDPAALQRALHALRSQHAASVRDTALLVVEELDGSRSLEVRASQTIPGLTYLGERAVRVTIELIAAWPIKAGQSRTGTASGSTPGKGRNYPRNTMDEPFWTYGASGASGDLFVVNSGNAPVHPVWTIEGPVTNPSIIAPDQGRHLTFAITLLDGDVLAADAETHAVMLNQIGNRRYVLTPDSAWFDILPGEQTIQYRSDSDTGTLTAYFSDGWW